MQFRNVLLLALVALASTASAFQTVDMAIAANATTAPAANSTVKTAPPSSTTMAPNATTAAPKPTTAAPNATTSAPKATIATPKATTAAPAATKKSGVAGFAFAGAAAVTTAVVSTLLV